MWHSFLTYTKVHSMLGSNRLFNSIVQISSNRASREMFFAGAEQHNATELIEYGRNNPPTFKPNKYKRTMLKTVRSSLNPYLVLQSLAVT